MRREIAWLATVAALGVSDAAAKDACGGSDAKFYDEGLIFHLSRAKVPYRRMYGGGLCVEEKYASQLKAAEAELDRYFPQIAHNPKDACEVRALVEWAEREKLRYDVRGSLFLLRSYTQEEMSANREKLDRSAPLGRTCGT